SRARRSPGGLLISRSGALVTFRGVRGTPDRLAGAVDVEDAARGVPVRVTLRQRDATVDDDRAVPVSVPCSEGGELRPAARCEDVEAAVRVVDIQQAACHHRARARGTGRPGGTQPPAAERPGREAVAVGDEEPGPACGGP